MSKAKEAGLKAALSGLGGDELLAGYPSFVECCAGAAGSVRWPRGRIRLQGRRSGRRQLVPGFARVRGFIRQCGDAAATVVAPSWARWLLVRAAIAPPMWKTPLFERVWASLVRSSLGATQDVVVTNFGLNADLRCLNGLNKTVYAFGKFEHMLSERATFALVRELAGDCEDFVDVGTEELHLSRSQRTSPGATALV